MVNRIILFLLLFTFNLYAGERFPVPYRPDIDLTKKSVNFECGGIGFVADITRPLIPFKQMTFTLKANRSGASVNNLKIDTVFNMKMDMGNYNYKMSNVNGVYTLNFILPKCLWGDKRWYVKISIYDNKKLCDYILLFDMEK